jgi:hypothetical protein
MQEWHDFLVATAGASAALTGLVFVGVSINLNKILSIPTLPGRALISLILLLTILIISIILLVPMKDILPYGIWLLLTASTSWTIIWVVDIKILRNKEKQYKKVYLFNLVFNQIAIIPYLICGIFLVERQESGLSWLVIAFVFSFLKAFLDAWVLLIEINR